MLVIQNLRKERKNILNPLKFCGIKIIPFFFFFFKIKGKNLLLKVYDFSFSS